MVKPETYYKNIKTGNIYFVEIVNITDATNNTNNSKKSKMVLYYPLKDNNDLESILWNSPYVRITDEFNKKFEKVS